MCRQVGAWAVDGLEWLQTPPSLSGVMISLDTTPDVGAEGLL